MINKVKDYIKEHQGIKMKFRYNGARNQIDNFEGIIIETYNYIFTIKKFGEHEEIKSFSYNDVLIRNLEIY